MRVDKASDTIGDEKESWDKETDRARRKGEGGESNREIYCAKGKPVPLLLTEPNRLLYSECQLLLQCRIILIRR